MIVVRDPQNGSAWGALFRAVAADSTLDLDTAANMAIRLLQMIDDERLRLMAAPSAGYMYGAYLDSRGTTDDDIRRQLDLLLAHYEADPPLLDKVVLISLMRGCAWKIDASADYDRFLRIFNQDLAQGRKHGWLANILDCLIGADWNRALEDIPGLLLSAAETYSGETSMWGEFYLERKLAQTLDWLQDYAEWQSIEFPADSVARYIEQLVGGMPLNEHTVGQYGSLCAVIAMCGSRDGLQLVLEHARSAQEGFEDASRVAEAALAALETLDE